MKPEVYEVIQLLESQYHLSHRQAEAAIITVANKLFGRESFGEWKLYEPDAICDNNTMPARSNTRRVESYMEAMALSLIVDEVMDSNDESCVIYSNDGSSKSGVGAYVVQSLTINGKPRNLPTFGVFTESRETLAELMKVTLDILAAASGYKYSREDILKKINFVMTDSTSHNLNVIEQVCEELEVEDVPNTLLCNVHPLMLFQRKIKELCQQIHDQLGTQKLSDCFLVDIDFRNESFVVKAIRCLTNFINSDFSAKPWNRCTHFEEYIKPKENMSISLKDHRFNRLQDCALSVLHHLQDISDYLLKFPNITNGIAILDRSFVDMEILRPIFATIALLGIHITRPFQHLVIDKDTNYSTLLSAFSKLYKNLSEIPAENYITLNHVATFVSEEMFEKSLPDKTLLDSLDDMMKLFPDDIMILLKIALKMFADGFAYQKGNIFGFGPNKDDECGTVLKICSLDSKTLETLNNNAQVHNLQSERQVGETNYGLHIRGKKNLSTVSRKMVINRCSDLIKKKKTGEFKKFRKEAKKIKDLKLQWNEKMKVLQEKGYEEKELKNMLKESTKLGDLEFLKNQKVPGPFTRKQEVVDYMNSDDSEETKRDRLYKEVRYARVTSQTLPPTSALFRLRTKGNKYLPIGDYAKNLSQYLDDSHSVSKVTIAELHQVLLEVEAKAQEEATQQVDKMNTTKAQGKTKKKKKQAPEVTPEEEKEEEAVDSELPLVVGEHVAVYWDEGEDDRVWYLGVVDKVNEAGEVSVSHFKRTKKNDDVNWIFPSKKEVHRVRQEQILVSRVNVSYPLSVNSIRCIVHQEDIDTIKKIFDD